MCVTEREEDRGEMLSKFYIEENPQGRFLIILKTNKKMFNVSSWCSAFFKAGKSLTLNKSMCYW